MTEPSKNIRDYPKPVVIMATALVLTGIGGIIAIILLGVGALFGAVFGG